MAPKKKGNRKTDDDWEAEVAETIDPVAAATIAAKEAEAAKDAEEDGAVGGGGGLMAAIQENKNKKQKKGRPVNDSVDGEDPTREQAANDEAAIDAKAPQEANLDDEFAPSSKKGKPTRAQPKQREVNGGDADAEDGEGKGKSKKEKEKEKRDREKQRKKEQVRCLWSHLITQSSNQLL